MHNDVDSLELRSSMWLMPMALTTCSYHCRHRHIAKAYTAGKMSSCSKLRKLSVVSCGYETIKVFGDWTLPNPAGELRALPQTTYLDRRQALCNTEERAVNREKKERRDPQTLFGPTTEAVFQKNLYYYLIALRCLSRLSQLQCCVTVIAALTLLANSWQNSSQRDLAYHRGRRLSLIHI